MHMHILFSKKVLTILRQSTKYAHLWLGVQFPLELLRVEIQPIIVNEAETI